MQKMAEYIKCSKCKCKYINDEEHISKDFGYTRLNKRYRSCKKCRNVETEITDKHYKDVDKELRLEYEKEFGIDSRDYSSKLFTEEEQIDRKAKMLLFWDKHRPNIDIKERSPKLIAKLFYISDMRSQTVHQIVNLPDEIQKAIGDRYNTLMDELINKK
jgi:hypothetical protein